MKHRLLLLFIQALTLFALTTSATSLEVEEPCSKPCCSQEATSGDKPQTSCCPSDAGHDHSEHEHEHGSNLNANNQDIPAIQSFMTRVFFERPWEGKNLIHIKFQTLGITLMLFLMALIGWKQEWLK